MDAQEFRSLQEAYLEVYETETLEEKIATGTGKRVIPSASKRSELAKMARKGEDIGKKGKGFKKVAEKAAKFYGSKKAGERVAAAAMFKAQAHKENLDFYDIILSHLLDEGYADTPEQAEVIMVNMSEEWRESIVEATEEEKNERRARIAELQAQGRVMTSSKRASERARQRKKEQEAERLEKAANAVLSQMGGVSRRSSAPMGSTQSAPKPSAPNPTRERLPSGTKRDTLSIAANRILDNIRKS